ncbi:hypothetical protein AB6805_21450 [Chitinophaga sp. RCC_12]|uniref:hypothetical protein n=1 Tax=Chitinophaga sp. RCC_12 TaxID=3239226 RepID=UPI00352632C8
MEYIDKNEGLINYLSGEFSLLSAKLYKVDIYNDIKSALVIDLYLELLYTKVNNLVRLTFTEIDEFSFYHHRSNYFYNVERYKFFKNDNSIYLCLDPYEENQIISREDQNFILSGNVSGNFV